MAVWPPACGPNPLVWVVPDPSIRIRPERMSEKPKNPLRLLTEGGPLVALTVVVALLTGIVAPASAQFFNFGNFGGPPRPPQGVPQQRGGGGWFGGDFFTPFQQQAPQQRPREDFSRAP